MILFYDKDGNFIEKQNEAEWSYSQKRNREGTGKIALLKAPHGAKYASLYKGAEKIKDAVITENSAGENKVSTSIRTLESLFKNYRLPDTWRGWEKKPLNHVLADAIYGFDYIRKTTLEDFTSYLEKVNIDLNKIKDGDIHLAYRPLSEELYKQILEKQKEEKQAQEAQLAQNAQGQAQTASVQNIRVQSTVQSTAHGIGAGPAPSAPPQTGTLPQGQTNVDVNAFIDTERRDKMKPVIDHYIGIDLPGKIRKNIELEKSEKEKLKDLIETMPIFVPPSQIERSLLDKMKKDLQKEGNYSDLSSLIAFQKYAEKAERAFKDACGNSIQYYETGYITFAFDCGEPSGQRFVRWAESTGEKTYIGIQSVGSNVPITNISQVDFSGVPILNINRSIEKMSETEGVPIESGKRYVAIRFILKYVNADWINDFATHKVYNEKNELVDRTVRGFTPVLRAFEIITRRKTEFNLKSIPLTLTNLVEGVELSNCTILEAIQKIREKYPFDTNCFLEDGKVYFEFGESLVKDKKLQAAYTLRAGDNKTRELNNTNIKELKQDTQKINVLHCYGEGEALRRLYVRIPETGTYDGLAAVEETFTDGKIKTKEKLKEAGLKRLKEKRKDGHPVFEVETVLPIRLFDEVSLVHPETNTIYDLTVEEENISLKENKLTQKFGLGGGIFNPFEAFIKKEKQPDIRDYAVQPFALTAYGTPKSVILTWQGAEKEFSVRWKKEGETEYNFRKVKGFKTEFENIDDKTMYVFSVAGVVNNFVSGYTAEIKACCLGARDGKDGKDGKDGSTKFLPNLETAGEYENQIGTYQGQLYRWTGSKWELLNAVMPLNPAVHYDFENTDFDEEKAKRELKEAEEKKEKTKEAYEKAAADLKILQEKESNLRSQLEETKTRLKETELELVGHPLDEDFIRLLNLKERLEKDIKGLETQLKNLNPKLESAKRHAAEAKKEKEAAEKEYNSLRNKEYKLLDVSGNNRHAVFKGVIKKEKTPVGAAFHFDGTNELKYKTPDFMKAGKNRTHSRWFKIDDLTTEENNYLWFYGGSDRAWFDTGSIEMEIADVYSWILFEDLKENGWNHLAVSYNFKDNSTEVILYLNGKKYRVNEDGRRNYPLPDFCFEMSGDDWRFAEGSLSNLLFFDRVLTEQEILWLYLNPQYPVKNYTLADWQLDAGNPENALITHAPKYLGITENLTNTRTVIITKGERTGAVDANAGDWVLMGVTKDGWKCGVCYKWSGAVWEETENPQHTQAVLTDALELCRTMGKDEQIPAVQFAKKLVALEAFVENLSAQVVYFQKSVASLVSKTPKVGDQMIYMGHNYRQYDKNEPFSFGIDELAYKGYSDGKDIETWRELMTTKQLKNIAGMSILSLFLTGCVEAAGGVKAPVGTAMSENKVAGLEHYWGGSLAITADGQKAMIYGGFGSIYSDDGLKTFKKVTPNVNIKEVAAYQNKFYSVKIETADYYSSIDGVNWNKEGEIAEYKTGDFWIPINHLSASRLGFLNNTTGKRVYIHNPPEHKIQAPDDKPNRSYITSNSKFTIAYNRSQYDGLSISNDKGVTWEHVNIPALEKHNDKTILIDVYNEEFYLCGGRRAGDTDGYYVSVDGKNWVNYRPELKQMRAILPLKTGLLIAYDKGDDAIIENIASQNIVKTIKNCSVYKMTYYPQINSVVLTGLLAKPTSDGYLSVIPLDVLTGSGITNFETTDKTLVAQFGNGLQIAAYKPNAAPPSFVGTSYTFPSNTGDRLTIGRWF